MPDLDPDLRAKIDAAVAAGRVTRVATGVSGVPLPVWNGTNLVDPEGMASARRAHNAVWAANKAKMISAESAAMREAIRTMHGQGRFIHEMAAHLDVTIEKVRYYMRRMALPAHLPSVVIPPATLARRDSVVPLWNKGRSIRDIAMDLGIDINVIRNDVTCLREAGRIAPRVQHRSAA